MASSAAYKIKCAHALLSLRRQEEEKEEEVGEEEVILYEHISSPNAVVRALLRGKGREGEGEKDWKDREICDFEEAVLLPSLLEGGERRSTSLSLLFSSYSSSFLLPTPSSSSILLPSHIILFVTLYHHLPRGLSSDADAFLDLLLPLLPPPPLLPPLPPRPPPPLRPIKGKRNILITSALPYVNNVPHLGNIIGCVLSADVFARYSRARGHNVLYICGTDEYGTATETKAFEEKCSPREICDRFHKIHKAVYDWFDIDFDYFGRTSTPTQTKVSQEIFHRLREEGALVEQTQEQLYSDGLGKFLADRYVVGRCPKCGYEDARGDQCDNCGSLLNPTELLDPRCKFTGSTPRIVPSQHLFLNLPMLEEELGVYVKEGTGRWSANCNMITGAWLRDGLKPRCITRDLVWGTPVPLPGFEKKVFYVWFDAPIGYISITACLTPHWEEWWKNPEEVELVQFMGKDNVPFHTVIFPSTLLGTKDSWTMMHRISVTEYLNYESGKFSKSRGVGVFGNDAQATGISVDVFRYYLLSMRPETSDTVFTWTDLAAKNNTELLANLGNFVNRALTFSFARCEGIVPEAEEEGPMIDRSNVLGNAVSTALKEYIDSMDKMRMKEALYHAMGISKLANQFMQETAPWVLMKTEPKSAKTVLASCVGIVRILSIVLRPFIPGACERMREQMGLTKEEAMFLHDSLIEEVKRPYTLVPHGRPITKPEVLFTKISDEEVEELRARFSGEQGSNEQSASSSSSSSSSSTSENGSTKPKTDKATMGGTEKKTMAELKAIKEAKKAAKGGGGGGGGKGDKQKKESGPISPSVLDIRVGKIIKVSKHPNAESLYVEEIDIGEEKPRQVVSGLVKFIPEEKMLNARVLVLANVKPGNLRGVLSQGMVLCASTPEAVDLVQPPEFAPLGERVTIAGHEGEAEEVLKPKLKQFDAVAPFLLTNAEGVAGYQGIPFMTSKGACVSPLKGVNIK